MSLKILSSVVFWEARHVFLAADQLVLSKPSEPDVISARIYLHDILNVFEVGHDLSLGMESLEGVQQGWRV